MNARRIPRFALLLCLALAACGGSGGGGGGGGGGNCAPGPGPSYGTFAQNPTAAEAQLAADVVTLVNNERANPANGGPFPALTADANIAKMAFDYSVDMELRGFFAHLNPECEDPGVRLTRAGIPWSAYAENIAQGQVTAADVVSAWMGSPAHRANILNPTLTMIGVGARQAAGGTIWTQVFTTP
jgi:uncharacterized protein YkwD